MTKQEADAAYYARHREHRKAVARAYRVAHPEYRKGWLLAHPKYFYEWNMARRSALKELVLQRFGRVCVRCGSTEHLELDHIWPLVRAGGHGDPVPEWAGGLVFPKKYFQILCHRCNIRKMRGLL